MNPFDYFYPVFSYADDKPSGVYEGAQMNQYSLWKGLHMVDGPSQRGEDWDPVRFSLAYKSMTATEEDEDLLCESASLEEIDSLYNPGPEVPYNQILEAIVVNHYSRTEHRMKAVQRRIHAALAGAKDGDGQPLDILDPIVGKPKKSGSFATVTVQLPFTDGQVVSIVFHSPEVDRLRITADDEIIAFRWIMGRKDITQYVAPEEDPTIGGYREVPLATVAKRIAMLVAKNSAKFMGKAKKSAEDKAKLDAAESRVAALKAQVDELTASIDQLQNDKATEDKLGSTNAELSALKAENTELEAQIDALNKAISDFRKNVPSPHPTPDGKNDKDSTEKLAAMLEAKGWKRWTKDGKDRLYVDAVQLGLKVQKYGSGAVKHAEWDGEKISNRAAEQMLHARTYIDLSDLSVHSDNSDLKYAASQAVDQLLDSVTHGQPAAASDTGSGDTAPNAGDPIMDEINAIIAGKYDNEGARAVDTRFNNCVDEAEKMGRLDELDNVLQQADKHVTDLMAKAMANV